MDKSEKEFKTELMQVGMLVVFSILLLLLVSYLAGLVEEPTEISDEWAVKFNFATPTPTKLLGSEEGWWNDLEEGRPEALPTMPGSKRSPTPTPTLTPTTGTPLSEVDASGRKMLTGEE